MTVITGDTKNKVENTIKEIVSKMLLGGFTNRSHQVIASITSLSLFDIPLDEENSDRDTLIYGPIIIHARVYVHLRGGDGQASDSIDLRINSVKFKFDYDTKDYEIENPDKVALIDMTN